MRLQRSALVLAALFLALFTLQGCTSGDGGGEDGEKVIRFVSWKPSQPGVWNRALELFHREHPGIRVEREIGPHSSTKYHDLLTQKLKNRDSTVDVFFIDVIWPPEFAAAGWALELDEYFTEGQRAGFLPSTVRANTYKGHVYGVPFWISSGLLYYRKDLLDKYGFAPPETWPEMLEQIDTILKGEDDPTLKGFSGQFKQYEGLVCNMLEYVKGAGGELMDPDTGEPAVAGPEAVKAVRFVRDEIIGGAAPRGVLTYEEPESLALFVKGKAVFHRNWPYAWEVSNNPDKSEVAGKVGITTLPHFPGHRSFAALGGWQFGINSYSEQPELAWKFIEFMTSPRMQKFFAINAAQPPATPALYDDPEILEANPHFAEFKEVFLTAYPRPRTPFYPAVSNILQKYFSKALSYEKGDLTALAEEASEEIKSLQKRYTRGTD